MANNHQISLEAIKLGTQNFSNSNCIGEGRFWKLYEGEVADDNGRTPIVAKRWNRKSSQRYIRFLTELDTLSWLKDERIVALVGYCSEMDENIIVYKHASNGRLDKHLGDPSLTWRKRLKIGIDVANGLKFLHRRGKIPRVHRNIKSGSILLDGDWNAKISNFEFIATNDYLSRAEHVIDDISCDSLGYMDQYQDYPELTYRSDIYSLGVVLIEMLCGRLAWGEGCENHYLSLGPLAVEHYNSKGNIDEMIFKGTKEQIALESLTTYLTIALKCLSFDWDRPEASDVAMQLNKALKFQVSFDTFI
ncbi:putative protein kinase RLK-Pelle-CrRLK1L-1 family [Helianthus anomalus]